MNIHTADWTPERKNKAAALWLEGLSGSEIAARLGGVSRNAILGMADRNRNLFPPREKRKRQPARSVERIAKPFLFKTRKVVEGVEIKARVPKPPKAKPVRAVKPEVYDAASLHKPLIGLQANECRWPVGHDQHGHLFCGHEASGPYCAHHKARSVGQGTVSERNAISEARRKA